MICSLGVCFRTDGRRRHKALGDRGSSAIELAILVPLLLVMIWLVIQFALWFQSRSVALAAAQAGARVARDEAGIRGSNWQNDSVTRTTQYYNALGTKILGGGIKVVSIGTANKIVGVQVTGTVSSLIPGLTLTITESSQGPVECFHPVQGAGTCN